jgi:regulator of sigma E protease
MNLLLPFGVFTALKVAGEPQPRAEVGTVLTGSVAQEAGLVPEDRVVSVEGVETRTWVDVAEALAASTDATVDLVIDRQGAAVRVGLPVVEGSYGSTRSPIDFGMLNLAPDASLAVDDPASPAARAGVRTGDRAVRVDGVDVRSWNEVRRIAAAASGRPLTLELLRAGEGDAPPTDVRVTLQPDAAWVPAPTDVDDAAWRAWGLASAMVVVGAFGDGDSAARDAGILEGDRLLAVDGRPVHIWQDVVSAVAAASTGEGSEKTTREMEVVVRRAGTVLRVPVTPKVVRDVNEIGRYRYRALLGIASGAATVDAPMVPRPYPLVDSFVRATDETVLIGNFMVEQIGKMLTGEAPPQENLGGPVAIFRETRAAAERGIYDWARQLGLFSLSLGIINLLPIPVLDGGRLVMYSAEWVRGRPLPPQIMERAQQVGVIFLVLLMLFVFANDLRRWAEAA